MRVFKSQKASMFYDLMYFSFLLDPTRMVRLSVMSYEEAGTAELRY